MMDTDDSPVSRKKAHGVGFGEAFRVWLKIALLSFGGPAGQIAVMHRVLVEEKRWISESRFLHALNYCMVLPGPEAQQLATYIGWLMHKTAGGLMAGGLFIAPGLLSIMSLSVIYVLYGNLGFVAALFFGLKAAVLAIVLQAVLRIGRRALKNSVMKSIAALSFLAMFFFATPFPLIILLAGLTGFGGACSGNHAFLAPPAPTLFVDGAQNASLLGEDPPDHAQISVARACGVAAIWGALWLTPVFALLILAGSQNVFTRIAVFFSKMAVVAFGGAYTKGSTF